MPGIPDSSEDRAMTSSDDDIAEMQFEEALSNEEPWALEAQEVRKWAAMQGLRVRGESETHGWVEGIWDWHGQRSEDFYLVRILDDDGQIIVGTDPRNFDAITVLSDAEDGSPS